jgi:predicted DNA-binding protein
MVRTQIYMTPRESQFLSLLAKTQGRTKSEIIRGILDEKLDAGIPRIAAAAAKAVFGAWAKKSGKNDLKRLRSYW